MQIINVSIAGEIVPYVRVGRERWTDRARRYLSSRDWLRGELARAFGASDEDRAAYWSVILDIHRYKARGDTDNLLKAVLDAAEGVLWDNDGQVYDVLARRWPCAKGGDRLDLSAYTVPERVRPKERRATARKANQR